jgi:hypothetical protein
MYNQVTYLSTPLSFRIFPQAVYTVSNTGRPIITTSGLTAQPINYLSPVRVLNSNPSAVVLQKPSSVLPQYIPINNPTTTKLSYTPAGITITQQPQVAIQTNRIVNAGVYSYPYQPFKIVYPLNNLIPQYPLQYVIPGTLPFGIWSRS